MCSQTLILSDLRPNAPVYLLKEQKKSNKLSSLCSRHRRNSNLLCGNKPRVMCHSGSRRSCVSCLRSPPVGSSVSCVFVCRGKERPSSVFGIVQMFVWIKTWGVMGLLISFHLPLCFHTVDWRNPGLPRFRAFFPEDLFLIYWQYG